MFSSRAHTSAWEPPKNPLRVCFLLGAPGMGADSEV